MTAMLIHPSTEFDLRGTARQSHWKTFSWRSRQTFKRPLLRSQPIWNKDTDQTFHNKTTSKKVFLLFTFKIFSFKCRYFPLPQPMSIKTPPGEKLCTNCSTCGHGECLVSLKWFAISSYTLWTFSSSNFDGYSMASELLTVFTLNASFSLKVSHTILYLHSQGSLFRLKT